MNLLIRPIARAEEEAHAAEVDLVAGRMRETLMEVVDEMRGEEMYTLDWLRARVRFHLDEAQCTGEVLLAERAEGKARQDSVVGHTILRIEQEQPPLGLFSTFYVHPTSRRDGVASALLEAGEAWFRRCGMARFATNTAATNHRLHRLMERHGYVLVLRDGEMVRFEKDGPS